VQPILGAIGLAHDLGNPPFGHQGEAAIRGWFEKQKEYVFADLEDELRKEFLSFDGNPQSLRVLMRLHASAGYAGLDLTAATIMALLKYPVSVKNVEKHPAKKKLGYFRSEKDIIDWARAETGLEEGQRHPLTWIMEAADDIAYSVLDVEDSMKKGILSPDDLFNILSYNNSVKKTGAYKKIKSKFRRVDGSDRSPSIKRDIKMGYAHAYLIADLVEHATNNYIANIDSIYNYSLGTAVMDDSEICSCLKEVAAEYAFGNTEVLDAERQGRAAVETLLCHFWRAIDKRVDPNKIDSKREDATARYVFSLLSPNYLESATKPPMRQYNDAKQLRYLELRLLTDMIAGMTDKYVISLSHQI